MYKLAQEDARGIALNAMELKTCSVLDSTGYYCIYEDDDNSVEVNINKDDGYFAVFICNSSDETEWYFTEELDVDELITLLMELSDNWSKDYINS